MIDSSCTVSFRPCSSTKDFFVSVGSVVAVVAVILGACGLANKIAGMKQWQAGIILGSGLATAVIALRLLLKPTEPTQGDLPVYGPPENGSWYIPIENPLNLNAHLLDEIRYGNGDDRSLNEMVFEVQRPTNADMRGISAATVLLAMARYIEILETMTPAFRYLPENFNYQECGDDVKGIFQRFSFTLSERVLNPLRAFNLRDPLHKAASDYVNATARLGNEVKAEYKTAALTFLASVNQLLARVGLPT